MRIQAYIHTHRCERICTYVCSCMHTYTYIHTDEYIYIYVHTGVRTHAYMQMRIYIIVSDDFHCLFYRYIHIWGGYD